MPRPKKQKLDATRHRKVGWLFFVFQVVLLAVLWLWNVNHTIEMRAVLFVYLLSTIVVLVALWVYDHRAADAAFDVLSPL